MRDLNRIANLHFFKTAFASFIHCVTLSYCVVIHSIIMRFCRFLNLEEFLICLIMILYCGFVEILGTFRDIVKGTHRLLFKTTAQFGASLMASFDPKRLFNRWQSHSFIFTCFNANFYVSNVLIRCLHNRINYSAAWAGFHSDCRCLLFHLIIIIKHRLGSIRDAQLNGSNSHCPWYVHFRVFPVAFTAALIITGHSGLALIHHHFPVCLTISPYFIL